MAFDTVVRNARLVTAEAGPVARPVSIAIQDGTVAGIFAQDTPLEADLVLDARGNPVLPGAIDTHVHWNNPGPFPRGAGTESLGAALGGVTSVLNFYRPAGERPYEEAIPAECEGGEANSYIDFAFHLGVLVEEQLSHLDGYVRDLGVTSFKFYMTMTAEAMRHHNRPGAYTDSLLYEAMREMARRPGTVACVHAENVEIVTGCTARVRASGAGGLKAYADARPPIAEAEATHRALFLGEQTGCPVFIPHISCKAALDQVRAFKARGARAYGETCPHYLTHTYDSPAGVFAKINPPIRSEAEREALWAAIADGTIDTIGSDNVAITRKEKQGDIWQAAAGFATGGLIVPVLLSEGVNRGRISLQRAAEVTSYNAAKLFGLYPKKGTLQVGSDADLIIVDLDLERTLSAEVLRSNSDFCIYDGMTLRGWPSLTMVRGRVVARDGDLVGTPGHGRYLRRSV